MDRGFRPSARVNRLRSSQRANGRCRRLADASFIAPRGTETRPAPSSPLTADYAGVRELVADVFAEGIEEPVRKTVDAVSALKTPT